MIQEAASMLFIALFALMNGRHLKGRARRRQPHRLFSNLDIVGNDFNVAKDRFVSAEHVRDRRFVEVQIQACSPVANRSQQEVSPCNVGIIEWAEFNVVHNKRLSIKWSESCIHELVLDNLRP